MLGSFSFLWVYRKTKTSLLNAGGVKENSEAKNRVIERSALLRGFPYMGRFVTMKRPNAEKIRYF